MIRNLVCIGVALLVAAGSLAYGEVKRKPYDPDAPVPPVADSAWEENLGNGVLGQLAFAVSEGRGMELAREWGFEPDREIAVSSIADLGEYDIYAPPGFSRMGWSGTAHIQGSFTGNQYDEDFVPGIVVFELDNGVVPWIHATEAWLNRLEHPGDWQIQGEEWFYPGVAEEVRTVISLNPGTGDDVMVHGLGVWGMMGIIDSVKLRLVYPTDSDSHTGLSRYDIWLKNSRVAELEQRHPADGTAVPAP